MKKFGKDDTMAVKGIAIVFLLWHHCFFEESRFSQFDINFFPFTEGLGIYFGELLKICVGMFAFLSAYGIARSVRKKYGTLVLGKKESYAVCTHRIVSMMGGYFFVFLLCNLVCAVIDQRPFHIYGTGRGGLIYFLIDMLGLADVFHTPSLIYTWWYIGFAIVLIFIMPLFLRWYDRAGVLLIPMAIVLPLILPLKTATSQNYFRWLLCVVLGIACAAENILERAKGWLSGGRRWLRAVGAAILLTAIVVCKQTALGKTYIGISDGITTLAVIVFTYSFVTDIPVVRNILMFLGKHSMNMFLIHNFIRYTYLNEWTYSFKNAFAIVFVLLLESLFVSICIEKLKSVTGYKKLFNKEGI